MQLVFIECTFYSSKYQVDNSFLLIKQPKIAFHSLKVINLLNFTPKSFNL
jgi:hypothetical protein